MDITDHEGDVQLQKAASGLLADFAASLHPFLWREVDNGGGGRKREIRWRMRVGERDRLVRLLSPFQELPQLLDPHLQTFIPALADAYLASLLRRRQRQRHNAYTSSTKPVRTLLVPLQTAVCQLLYVFCKIRGEKVIVRFLSAETRNLEVLLAAVEDAEVREEAVTTSDDDQGGGDNGDGLVRWTWEERYICLLWLSHLLLAPFDLATISSADTEEGGEMPVVQGLEWPANLPSIAVRVVPLAVKYLASAGKERDAAKALLVRISMRKDMQELGLLHALVQWAVKNLQTPSSASESTISTYQSIGVLSFLGGLLVSSASTSDMNPYLSIIFRTVQAISEEENTAFKGIRSSALARKIIIKVMRAIAVITLQLQTSSVETDPEWGEIVEVTIGHMLESLADNDTPVRLAASKALSIITFNLSPVMATQVIEAVLDSLNHNILWIADPLAESAAKIRDLSAVNPLEWHGLILTLSHLLYRRSPPPENLSEILNALLTGLSFERRSTSGSSIGTNVRDAACFGIWALARRYTTAELSEVSIPTAYLSKQDDSSNMKNSILQVLATELVVSASLDPAGNIRRGASAALQELIGRHPDIVAEGIAVVQVVDYHAVALRSRAMLEVAPKAELLSGYYQDSLLSALFSWRGIGDGDAASRRNTAILFGLLTRGFQIKGSPFPWKQFMNLMKRIEIRLASLTSRESDQRHGLLLSLAAVMASLPDIIEEDSHTDSFGTNSEVLQALNLSLLIVKSLMESAKSLTDRRAEMVAEGLSRVVSATVPVLKIDDEVGALIGSKFDNFSKRDNEVISYGYHDRPPKPDTCFEQGYFPHGDIVRLSEELLMTWLRRTEIEVVEAATDAAVALWSVMNASQRNHLIRTSVLNVKDSSGGRLVPGFIFTLATVFPLVSVQQNEICTVILRRWQAKPNIEGKVIILQSLSQGNILDSQMVLDLHMSQFVNLIADGLDDYTTDGRGDIGSLVRAEALKVARKAFNSIPWNYAQDEKKSSKPWFTEPDTFGKLYGRVLRLSAEKLDRVRVEAQLTLAAVCRYDIERTRFESFSISSFDYFRWLLELQVHNWLALPFFQYAASQWHLELLEGFVSSADTGSEDLIRVSRAALAHFCDSSTSRGEDLHGQMDIKEFVCESLFEVAKRNISNDRVLVPTLEVISFLFDAGIMQQTSLRWRSFYLLVQKAHYKTGNVRKLEAAIKVYGGLLQVYPEALEKLTSMLLHPFPKLRNQVADILFVAKGVGKGVDWTKAGKDDLKRLKEELAGQGSEG